MGEPYAHPEVLVSADWVEAHLRIRRFASSRAMRTFCFTTWLISPARQDRLAGRPSGPVGSRLHQRREVRRDLPKSGIANGTTVVFYGDKSNWWACYAFWAFKLFGHADCRVLNGGRKLWLDQGRPTSTEVPELSPHPVHGPGESGGSDSDLP